SNFLKNLILEYNPHHLAIENLYFAKNTTTAMRVAEIRGLIFGLALSHQMEIFEYDPVTIKLAVTGFGKADKAAVTKLTLSQLKLTKLQNKEQKIIDDAVDALAVGLTHAVSYRN
ncbi:crossover junction endodeoxyribonuclease RuvC, partial [Patescibacteria group bacterium]|nr:crossover junction endodeoxyribonuclease RuvC [Patescibacteria group bacterium]